MTSGADFHVIFGVEALNVLNHTLMCVKKPSVFFMVVKGIHVTEL